LLLIRALLFGVAFRFPVIPKEASRGIFRNAGGQWFGILHGGGLVLGFGWGLDFQLPVIWFIRLYSGPPKRLQLPGNYFLRLSGTNTCGIDSAPASALIGSITGISFRLGI
jgi:hypothetical protein